MASIRKIKIALKREIRRLDAAIIELSKHDGLESAMWDLFLCRNYFLRQIKYIGKEEPNPWTGEGRKPISFSELEQRNLIKLINGESS